MRVCPKCPPPGRTQYSGTGASDICEVHGWVEAVEVVPCDDAAVERIARWLHNERFGVTDEPPCGNCVEDARSVLRAAGETP